MVIDPPVGGMKYGWATRWVLWNFALMALAGAALVGAASGLIGGTILAHVPAGRILSVALLVIVSAYCVWADLASRAARVPTFRWMIPRRWKAYGNASFARLFGFLLGLGFVTTVKHSSYYVMLLAGLVDADPLRGALAMSLFGVGRAFPVLLARAPGNGLVQGPPHSAHVRIEAVVNCIVSDRLRRIRICAVAGILGASFGFVIYS